MRFPHHYLDKVKEIIEKFEKNGIDSQSLIGFKNAYQDLMTAAEDTESYYTKSSCVLMAEKFDNYIEKVTAFLEEHKGSTDCLDNNDISNLEGTRVNSEKVKEWFSSGKPLEEKNLLDDISKDISGALSDIDNNTHIDYDEQQYMGLRTLRQAYELIEKNILDKIKKPELSYLPDPRKSPLTERECKDFEKWLSNYIKYAEEVINYPQLPAEKKVVLRETLAPLKAFRDILNSPQAADKTPDEIFSDTSWLKGFVNTGAPKPEAIKAPESLGKTTNQMENIENYKTVVKQTGEKLTEYLGNISGDKENSIETLQYKTKLMGYVIEACNNPFSKDFNAENSGITVANNYKGFLNQVNFKDSDALKNNIFIDKGYFILADESIQGASTVYKEIDNFDSDEFLYPEHKEIIRQIKSNMKSMRMKPENVGLDKDTLDGLDNTCQVHRVLYNMASSVTNRIDKIFPEGHPFQVLIATELENTSKMSKIFTGESDIKLGDFDELDNLVKAYESYLLSPETSFADEEDPMKLDVDLFMMITHLDTIKEAFPDVYGNRIDNIKESFQFRVADYIRTSLSKDEFMTTEFSETIDKCHSNGLISDNEMQIYQALLSSYDAEAGQERLAYEQDEAQTQLKNLPLYQKNGNTKMEAHARKYLEKHLKTTIIHGFFSSQMKRYYDSKGKDRLLPLSAPAQSLSNIYIKRSAPVDPMSVGDLTDRLMNHQNVKALLNGTMQEQEEFLKSEDIAAKIESMVLPENVLSQITEESMEHLCEARVLVDLGVVKYVPKPSPEFKAVRNKLTELQSKIRNIEEPTADDYMSVFRACSNYLNLKDPSPFSDTGKHRFEASSEILLKFGEKICEMNPDLAEEVKRDIKNTIIRSAKFRRMVTSSAHVKDLKEFAVKAGKELGDKDVSTKLKTPADIEAFSKKYEYVNNIVAKTVDVYGDLLKKSPYKINRITSDILSLKNNNGEPLPSESEITGDLMSKREEARRNLSYNDFRKNVEQDPVLKELKKVSPGKRAQKERISDEAAKILVKQAIKSEAPVPKYMKDVIPDTRGIVSMFGILSEDQCQILKEGTPNQVTELFNQLMQKYADIDTKQFDKALSDEELIKQWAEKSELIGPLASEYENVVKYFKGRGADVSTVSNKVLDKVYTVWKDTAPYYDYYQNRLQNISSEYYSYMPDDIEANIGKYEEAFTESDFVMDNKGMQRTINLRQDDYYAAICDAALNRVKSDVPVTGIYDTDGTSYELSSAGAKAELGKLLCEGKQLIIYRGEDTSPQCCSVSGGLGMPVDVQSPEIQKDILDDIDKKHEPYRKAFKETKIEQEPSVQDVKQPVADDVQQNIQPNVQDVKPVEPQVQQPKANEVQEPAAEQKMTIADLDAIVNENLRELGYSMLTKQPMPLDKATKLLAAICAKSAIEEVKKTNPQAGAKMEQNVGPALKTFSEESFIKKYAESIVKTPNTFTHVAKNNDLGMIFESYKGKISSDEFEKRMRNSVPKIQGAEKNGKPGPEINNKKGINKNM